MPPQVEAETVALIDRLHKLIKEVPLEYLGDVEAAARDLFKHRREEEAEKAEGGAGGADCANPAKRRRKEKSGGKSRSGLEDLKALQAYLREKVPVEAVLPSESLHYNPTGDFADHTAANTVSVDSFLWDEADVDELCDEGKLSRNFCLECGSRNTKPLNFVSHSLSIAELNFVFTKALPAAGGMKDGLLVDVGSRLGCVPFAAAVLGGAGEAVGVEINKDLCDVQTKAFKALGAGDKVRVVCGDICDQEELLKKARVVVLHNPFHFFQDLGAAAKIWKKIAKLVQKGTLLVASPPLPEQLLQASDPPPVELSSWVETLEVDYPQAEDPDDEHADDNGLLYTSIQLYRVL